MGLTYAQGMSKSNLIKKKNIIVLDKSDVKLKELHKIAHFDTFEKLENCVPKADIIFIAVKPYNAVSVFDAIKPFVQS
jgi:pyrroline-5-carboxylate reductase